MRAGDGCLMWTGAVQSNGYGHLARGGGRGTVLAHRVAYTLAYGPIPSGLVIDHLCRNRLCCEPTHLEAVTSAENTRRGGNAIKTHCAEGHPYAGDNLFIDSHGRRRCRKCVRARNRESYARRVAT